MRRNKKNPESVDKDDVEVPESADAEEVDAQVSGDADVIEDLEPESAGETDAPEPEVADEADAPEPGDADENEDPEPEDADENESVPQPAKKDKLSLVDPKYKITWLLTLPAGILGAVIGFILISLFTYSTGKVFFPLFVIAPLLAFLFNSLFKGGRDIRSLIVIAAFSLVFAYSTELAGRAALFARENNISAIKIPSLVVEAFGRIEAFASSLSDNTYPIVFTALGIFLTWELLRAGRIAGAGSEIQDPELEENDADPDADSGNDEDPDEDVDSDADSGNSADSDDDADSGNDACLDGDAPDNDLDSDDDTDSDD